MFTSIGLNINPSIASTGSAVITLDKKSINIDGSVIIGVRATGVPEPGLGGYDFEISYDPSVVEFVDIQGSSDFSLPTFNGMEKGIIYAASIIQIDSDQTVGAKGDIHLFDISFRAIAQSGSTEIKLKVNDFTGYSLGNDFPELIYQLENGNIENTMQLSIQGKVMLEGRMNNSGISIELPNTSISATTDSNGDFALTGVQPGTYTIELHKSNYLIKKITNVVVKEGLITYLPSSHQLKAGDFNNDNKISLLDLGGLKTAYGYMNTDANYNINADFNLDGKVSLLDLGLLKTNYGQFGD